MKYLVFFAILFTIHIVFCVLSICKLYIVPVFVALCLFDESKKGAKKKLKEESAGKGLLFNKNVIVSKK
jgi:hypothetical protein